MNKKRKYAAIVLALIILGLANMRFDGSPLIAHILFLFLGFYINELAQ